MHSRPQPTVRATRRATLALAAVVALVVASIGLIASPAGAATCRTTWGSGAKTASPLARGPITGARAGQHACFDRFVVDLRSAPAPGWNIRYVTRVTADGSGAVVPLRGGAFLQLAIKAPTYDLAGHPTYAPARPGEAVPVAGFRTFRQIAYAGSYEGITTFGVGVRARLPFRVFVLPGPGAGTRLVIDVAHSWA